MAIEKKIENALRQAGYVPEKIFSNRKKIRGLLFYPRGQPLREPSLTLYLPKIQKDVFQSTPYSRIMQAKNNYELSLRF